ncbi:hypothetical protein [Chitinolyticbacter meiyuanensis]|uniref:hypothetical protein n=1 Tax=Chitinolyticbacter meiyuanensis TaxID=682798 RepID=UPI0011E5F2F9|nr:hypothetical protein [Chitinolyticbacter meiyuanensis]
MPLPLIGAVLSAIAPQLAKRGLDLLSGIFRGAIDQGAEQVTELIKEKTGIDIADVADNKLTDDQWLQLKQFELDNQAQLIAWRQQIDAHELEMEKLRAADLQDARATGSKRDDNDDPLVRRFTYHYAYLITGLTFVFIVLAILLPFLFSANELPRDSAQIINTVVGFLLGVGLSTIIQYFYGSSRGSSNKQKQLDELTQRMAASRLDHEGGR